MCVLHVPVELGLSWDSTLRMKCTGDFLKDSYSERNMRFGIREFGMGAVSNALSLDKTGAPGRAKRSGWGGVGDGWGGAVGWKEDPSISKLCGF